MIVDGRAEHYSLSHLYPRLEGGHTILNPLWADIQPLAAIPKIARAAKASVKILSVKRVDRIIVLIDFERRNGLCVGDWSASVRQELRAVSGFDGIEVVAKTRMFENWLIADPSAFSHYPKRFRLSGAAIRSIEPNRADGLNASYVLKECIVGTPYDKIADAQRILRKANPRRMAMNSRSFRKFLNIIGHPEYATQSAVPASDPRRL